MHGQREEFGKSQRVLQQAMRMVGDVTPCYVQGNERLLRREHAVVVSDKIGNVAVGMTQSVRAPAPAVSQAVEVMVDEPCSGAFEGMKRWHAGAHYLDTAELQNGSDAYPPGIMSVCMETRPVHTPMELNKVTSSDIRNCRVPVSRRKSLSQKGLVVGAGAKFQAAALCHLGMPRHAGPALRRKGPTMWTGDELPVLVSMLNRGGFSRPAARHLLLAGL